MGAQKHSGKICLGISEKSSRKRNVSDVLRMSKCGLWQGREVKGFRESKGILQDGTGWSNVVLWRALCSQKEQMVCAHGEPKRIL